MSLKAFIIKKLLRIEPGTEAGTSAGELRADSAASNKLKYHNGTDEKIVVRADGAGDLEFDNTISGLAATNVKAALDEIDSNVDTVSSDKIEGVESATTNTLIKFVDTTGKAAAETNIVVDASDNVTGVNDLTVTGDLTVNGTTTTVNTSILDVTDANITVNNGGNQTTADDTAGLTVEMSDATDASLIYDKDATSRWRAGDVGSEVELATISGAQAITNKDIDGGTASNTSRLTVPSAAKATLDGLTRKEATIVWATDEDKLYGDDGSALLELGSGGGGAVDFLEGAGKFETGTGSWATYDDGAVDTPIDGTGGSPGITLTQTASSPWEGDGMGVLSKPAADHQGEGISYDFTIDRRYREGRKRIAVKGSVNLSSSYQAGDLGIWIYDIDNAALITPNEVDSLSNDATINGTGEFLTTFDATDSVNYRLIFHITSTNASSWTVNPEVIVTPDDAVFGSPITDWVDFTLTIGSTGSAPSKGGGTQRDEARWRRVGDSMEIRYDYTQTTGGSNGTGDYIFEIPSGYSIDSTKQPISSDTEQHVVGNCQVSNGGIDELGVVVVRDSGGVSLVTGNEATVFATVGASRAGLAASTIRYSFRAVVPITNWDSNIALSNATEFRISRILANGTRVTSSAPTTLGEYRSFRRNASAATLTETSADPATDPSAANGMIIYGGAWASTDAVNQPSAYDIFIGKNKTYRLEVYENTGRTGEVLWQSYVDGNNSYGIRHSYDPATGILKIRLVYSGNATTQIIPGTSPVDGSAITDAYFDVIVSEKALAHGIEPGVKVRYSTNAGQTLSNSTDTRIDFEDLERDTHNSVTTGSSWEFTAPRSGDYHISVHLAFTSNSTGLRSARLIKNGTTHSQLGNNIISGGDTFVNGSVDVELVAGDTIYINGFQNSGGNLSLLALTNANYICIHELR